MTESIEKILQEATEHTANPDILMEQGFNALFEGKFATARTYLSDGLDVGIGSLTDRAKIQGAIALAKINLGEDAIEEIEESLRVRADPLAIVALYKQLAKGPFADKQEELRKKELAEDLIYNQLTELETTKLRNELEIEILPKKDLEASVRKIFGRDIPQTEGIAPLLLEAALQAGKDQDKKLQLELVRIARERNDSSKTTNLSYSINLTTRELIKELNTGDPLDRKTLEKLRSITIENGIRNPTEPTFSKTRAELEEKLGFYLSAGKTRLDQLSYERHDPNNTKKAERILEHSIHNFIKANEPSKAITALESEPAKKLEGTTTHTYLKIAARTKAYQNSSGVRLRSRILKETTEQLTELEKQEPKKEQLYTARAGVVTMRGEAEKVLELLKQYIPHSGEGQQTVNNRTSLEFMKSAYHSNKDNFKTKFERWTATTNFTEVFKPGVNYKTITDTIKGVTLTK